MAPQETPTPRDPAQRERTPMDTRESSASAHPSTDEYDDTVEAQFSGLERLRPCVCMNGTVFIGHLVVGEDGEEIEVIDAVPCCRCADSR
jgi:hypothetical protein